MNVGVPVADDVPTPAMPAEAMPPDAMSLGAMSLDALPVPSGPPAALPLTGEAGSVAPLLGMTPLLLDVTPLSLGVETVDGYCEAIIQKNAAIPTEQTRLFTTARDGQTEVAVRICQGEDKRIEGNQLLGELQLFDLPAAVRGAVKVEVTFILDADGTLQARAEDKATGKAQSVRIQLVGAIREADVGAMQQRVDARYAPPNS
ncbi:MAG: Hsp70 family protein [Myxococcota bacterium]